MNKYLILWGGADINPALYKQPLGIYTSKPNDTKDKLDILHYKQAKKDNIPIIGICRGAQLAHVLNGGTLTQDITNHTNDHFITTKNNENFYVTSSHHQMMNDDTNGELIAWATHTTQKQINPLKNKYEDIYKTPEAIFYPKTKTLCLQYHPEWMEIDSKGYKWTIQLIKNIFNINIQLNNKHETTINSLSENCYR